MKLLKGNMLVQSSVVSLIMMTVVGIAILATLTTSLNNLRWLITGMVAGGFLALYCSLVWIIWRGWKTIINQRAQLRSFSVEQEGLLTQSSEEMDLVDEVGQIITSTLDIDEVYEKFAKEVKKLVDFDRIAINVLDSEAGVFVFKHTSGLTQAQRQAGDTIRP